MIEDYKNSENLGDIIASKMFAAYPQAFCTEILLHQADMLYNELLKEIPKEVFEEYDEGDQEVFTDRFHHRQFRNEIPNACIVDAILDTFAYQNELDKEKAYELRIYDLHDYPLSFDTEQDVYDFVEQYDCAPCTIFQNMGTWYKEIDSF